ncbi:MAG: hypothetical protein E7553_03380 [Ruminococcaceae bacterium]|nr:hypothetical protein [Oscillospiraceae bacterium]
MAFQKGTMKLMKTIHTLSAKVLSFVLVLSMLFSMASTCAFSVSAEAVIPTAVVRQNLAKWKNYTYGDSLGTLYRTGCGIFATVNAVGYLTGNEMSVTETAAWAHSIGGYNPGNTHAGTYRTTLYPKLQAKYGTRYGFTVDCGSSGDGYWANSYNTKLQNHLANGGTAIAHVPGHFIALVGYSDGKYHVYDSYPTSARPTGTGDCWKTPAQMNTGKLKVDWFVLLTRTGTVINNHAVSQGYKVTFDSRGGSSVAAQTVTEGGYAKKPDTPTREGFEFLGWFDENGWEFLFDTTAIWADRSLHAEWKAVTWPHSTDYMPTQSNLIPEAYTSGGDSSVWTYYNPYSGAVTLYKAGADYGWPTAFTNYNTSVDLSKYAYLNISLNATAQFNADILFLDANAVEHTVRLSEIVNGTLNDFAPGQYVITANVGNYLYGSGQYTLPENGIVNIRAIRYFVIGNTDDYVNLYSVCFSGEQNYIDLMNPDTLEQDPVAGATGSYTYKNGELNIEGTGGYAVSFYPNVTFSPQAIPNWIVSVGAGANFDISMIVTTSEGDKFVSLASDYYNVLGFSEYPELGIKDGQYSRSFNLLGMYEWNNILPADGQSVIKKLTFELRSQGDATLYAAQMCDAPVTKYFTDEVVKTGSWAGNITIHNDTYTLNEETEVIFSPNANFTVGATKSGMENNSYIRFFDGDTEVTDTAKAKSGLTVKVMNGDTLLAEYTLAVRGDINRDGSSDTADIRSALKEFSNEGAFTVAQEAAGDVDGDGTLSTADCRELLGGLM